MLAAVAVVLAALALPAAALAQDTGATTDASATTDTSASITDLHSPAQSSWQGAVGGIHLVDAAAGTPGSVRLQLGFDYFRGHQFLARGDTNENLGGTLALGITPIEHVEVFATFSTRSNSNNHGNPILIQIVGDTMLGVKGYSNVTPWLSLGGDMRAILLNSVGDLGVAWSGTSLGMRFDSTADFRKLQSPLPLIVRGNLDYLFDNSAALIQSVEDSRYRSLPPSTRRARINEDRNLVTRIERLALGIDRVDMLTFALGVEAPLAVGQDFFLHPLIEWQLGLPVNRQGYNCLSVNTNGRAGSPDGCLAVQGMSAAPSVLTLGVRVLPPVAGLTALLGFDIGLRGTSTFVRELAPTRPWALLLALGFGVENPPEPAAPAVVAASSNATWKVESAQPERARMLGLVIDAASSAPIPGAVVRYPGLPELNSQVTAADGTFTSYPLDPGEVVVEVSHADYDTRTCSAVIPNPSAPSTAPASAETIAPAPAAAPSSGLLPVDSSSPDGAAGAAKPAEQIPAAGAPQSPAASSVATDASAPVLVPLRCELSGHPRFAKLHGTLTNDAHAPVVSATITITGPSLLTLQSDPQGNFSAQDLPVGEYAARVDATGYQSAQQSFSVAGSAEVNLSISLTQKPGEPPAPAPQAEPAKPALVYVTAHEVKIRKQIMFTANSAQIDARSLPLLHEIADVLNQNPQVKRVQVQGHTDNRGEPAQNMSLSQARAEAVVAQLVSFGVESTRLEAKGFGDSRPLAPNLTPSNRAQNRRVQFVITSKQ